MTLIPQRTVAGQVAAQLEQDIRGGVWQGWLPNERELSQRLHVSRSSLRTALEHLRRIGVTEPVHGIGHRIVNAVTGPVRSKRSVGLITPERVVPFARIGQADALWIEDFARQLGELDYELEYHHGRHLYRSGAVRALETLVARHAHDVWILLLSTARMQRWFMERKVPCVIAGSCHQGIDLPSVDLDYRAICRHAAGELLQRGHRRIALVNRRVRAAGDIESEAGFMEAAAQSNHPEVAPSVIWHDDSVESINAALRRTFARPAPPTGLVVAGSTWFLVARTALAGLGLRVPEDVSIISRNDEAFLEFVVPSPARYLGNPHLFANRMIGMTLRLMDRQPLGSKAVHLLPRFHAGGSLAAPRRP